MEVEKRERYREREKNKSWADRVDYKLKTKETNTDNLI